MGRKILKNLWLVTVVLIFAGFCLAATAEGDFSRGFVIGIAVIAAGVIIYLFAPADSKEA